MAAYYDSNTDKLGLSEQDPRTELESHANMVLLGCNCIVFEWSGRTCTVKVFTGSLGAVQHVPILTFLTQNIKEVRPSDAPEPLVKSVTNTLYVDSNLYHDMLPGHFVTGILHLVNKIPVQCIQRNEKLSRPQHMD